ncbi:arsenate reductase ArsC [Paraflavisolibacter sp. H34]|uniref:arsenate reductase ArsC n=1 Tax=Huijunlia imazamoxiresistens TaxID=3127457 RepID=UPI00301AD75B
MSQQHKVLFVCVHNSARSQMAEAFLNKYGAPHFQAESAGLEPGKLNPNVVEVMKEKGIDISQNITQGVFDLFQKGAHYNAVVTVCDGANSERCPIFPGMMKRIAWSFADPSSFTGTPEEILAQTRVVRDQVEEQVKAFVREASEVAYWIK